ncbi:acyl-CoA/acyl-ACP dehydrogenase [Micromonospora sp. WMMD1120]|uniref:acyl-CoA dehydrogenase family protein n=1 Tax=Micromonospora sp. WMMD1120 TaxID=3016106 RepID=UPI00241647E6|nr:acyl-CoA dehydrogenase family protein [Micromonospora sp. WMMD1120]MDG4807571.1 acyl-CoA/acyl-ACP dehydrogenase [Micromonospora sp. WMMD1120]
MTSPTDLAATIWPDVTHLLPDATVALVGAAAEEADRDGKPNAAGLDALRAVRWPGLPVPTQFGGGGAGLLACCAAQRRIGAADPALAIAVNMHLFSVGLMVEHWRRRSDVSWMLMEAIATQGRLVASAFAEPNLGGSVVRSTIRARRTAKGWQLSGRKSPCSLIAEADLVCLQVQSDPADGPEEVHVLLLPTKAEGVSVSQTWDTMSMRGSGSDTLVLDDCHVPDDLVFYSGPIGEDDDVVAAGLIWFALTSVAVYLGLAQAALHATQTLTGRGRIAHLDATRAELPSYQSVVGDQAARLLTLEAACAGLAAQMDAGADPQLLLPAALGLKHSAAEVVPAAVGALTEACGGVALSRRMPLERLWRDAQAIRFHPPTGAATRQYLGRLALRVPAFLDLDESAPRLRAATAGDGEHPGTTHADPDHRRTP